MGSNGLGHGAPLRVLIVDDEPDVQLLLRVQLEGRSDVEVVGAAVDGREAVELCRSVHPDAVIMDLLMPVMDGFQAIDVIQSEMPGIGVVAHSAVGSEHTRQEMARHGVELVLKSGEPGPLIEALKAAADRATNK
jgi:two-component system, NarL family, nitrate/nitrite response regulator NarL